MKRIMLIGRTSAGKTSFCQVLHHHEIKYKKTQAIEIIDNAIDTPGEYVENRALYRALVVTAADADVVILVQDCTDPQCFFAPNISGMFNRPTIGLATKIDLVQNEEEVLQAMAKLELAGCEKVFKISSTQNIGVDEVRKYLGIAE
ncbi:EutP/PduV family microcompartment system protein [Youxingia wuxianensis]|uniref:EutP/PduV family microcompartment system protein n=1 Tax=Youxingia wuxianensis TaxID=2763678 RepID=A0A926ERC7_9FIRM|nr:EutP/PduV family microcompartment system protein [Youxingia wuxianensis]MBC8585232.1 EutP/PduV family microcompartment system protein [Youxingia wuxianensis]